MLLHQHHVHEEVGALEDWLNENEMNEILANDFFDPNFNFELPEGDEDDI